MVNQNKRSVPYPYVYFYKKLKEIYPYNTYLTPKEIIQVLKDTFRNSIPKGLHFPILHQMGKYKLIKRINRLRYRILKYDADLVLEKLRIREFWD